MDDIKNRIEAILFTTGRFMDIEEISKLCGIGSRGLIKDAVQELKQDYEKKAGSLQIFGENGKFKLSIRKEYVYLTSKLLNDTEMDRPTQETLAIIAYKQPILQSVVVKIRGNNAYEHVKTLKENEFITAEKHGRTRLLKLTSKFYDYFDTAMENLRQNFSNVEEKVGVKEMEEAEKEIEDMEKKDKEAPKQ